MRVRIAYTMGMQMFRRSLCYPDLRLPASQTTAAGFRRRHGSVNYVLRSRPIQKRRSHEGKNGGTGEGSPVPQHTAVLNEALVFDDEMHAAILLPADRIMLQAQRAILAVTGDIHLQFADA
jgi:hypothetical protein